MGKPVTKQALKEELVRVLQDNLRVLEHAQAAAREGATHEEAKAENDKDTRALEQSYLARGQAQRVEEMRAGLAAVQALPLRRFGEDAPVALGALVTVQEEDLEQRLWLVPAGGGTTLADGTVQVITPRSPLGAALLGKYVDEDGVVRGAGRPRTLTVTAVE